VTATRRHLLRAAALALLPGTRAHALAPQAGRPGSPARVAFLSPEQGAAALRQPGDPYYAGMGLLEIRARMHAPLAGMSPADARAVVREYDAAAVLAFSAREQAAIRGVIDSMQALLGERAPLYARTPWSFIKLDGRAEGGMPHTRGPHIVLPAETAAHFAAMQRETTEAGAAAAAPRGRGLLLHEQTHVLQRADPARFEPLFTQVFGFTRMAPAPANDWLSAHRCTNPDGPAVEWAFALGQIGGSGWVMPDVTLPDTPRPSMPEDFQAVGVEVEKTADGWRIVARDGVPRCRDLDAIPGYHAHFPFPDEDFHPHEIAAVALSHWILRDVPDLDARPLMPAIAAWATAALA